MIQEVMRNTQTNMNNAINAFTRELGTIRAGRANATLLDGIQVSYYGANTPLNQLAQISVPEARMIVITPYDKNILGDIEKAIKKRAKPVEERAAKPEKTEVHKKLSIETLSNEAKIVYNQLNKPIFYPDEINNTSLEPGDILSALTDKVLSLPLPLRDTMRASLLKNMLVNLNS